MITAIDSFGRLLIPKAIREQAGLLPGEPLEVTLRDGRIEIELGPREVRILERNELRVAELRVRPPVLDELDRSVDENGELGLLLSE